MSEAIIDSQKTEKHRLAFLVKKYLLGFFRKVTPKAALERLAQVTPGTVMASSLQALVGWRGRLSNNFIQHVFFDFHEPLRIYFRESDPFSTLNLDALTLDSSSVPMQQQPNPRSMTKPN